MADEQQDPEQDSEEGLELSPDEPRFSQDEVNAAEAQIVEQAKRIDFYITEYSVELLANKMKTGDFLVPSYQREFTWEHERRTRFIESLLMGLPIPFLIFWTDPKTGVLEIVDGSQRLRTIQEFILGDMVLGDLEELSRLVGFRFRDLPLSRQRKIKNLSIRGIILNQHADEQARFDVFERINTGSKTANTAEVRRGALGGLFLDLVRRLAKDPLFVGLAPMSRTQRDLRQDEELVTRFFAYGDGLDGYEDRVSPFLYAYTKRMNIAFSADAKLADLYEARFQQTMQFVAKHFPFGFRRMKGGASTPKARFEAIAVGSYLALSISPKIAEQDLAVEDWISEGEFRTVAGSGSANAVGKLRGRMNFVRDKLLGH